MERALSRRRFLTAVSGVSAAVATAGCQRAERVRRVEPDPGAGFHHPYYLATPASYRSGPAPILVEANNADETRSRREEIEGARDQASVLSMQGAWLSEMLGIPHLKTAFPEPAGDPATERIETAQLDRTAMLLDGTDLARIDRQTLAMVEHARDTLVEEDLSGVAGTTPHDQFLLYGNSSEAQFAARMAIMHPEAVLGVAATAVNGTVILPLERLAGRPLNYPVGVADFDAIVGNSYDPDAYDDVNLFFAQGGEDPKLRLFMDKEKAMRRNNWDDEEIYETARLVYGPRMVEDRLPRCHVAYEKAGVPAQFRVYPEMPHGDTRAMHDIFEFLRRSIEGEDVSGLGQRLRLPFDRTIELGTPDPGIGDELQFEVSGPYPPPEGLVSYEWHVDDGRSSVGPTAAFTFEDPGDYDVRVAMETSHGQTGQLGMSLLGDGASFAALQYAVTPPGPRYLAESTVVPVDASRTFEVEVTNVGSAAGDRRLEFIVGEETVSSTDIQLAQAEATTASFEHTFEEPGDVDVRVPPAYRDTMTVRG